MASDQYAKVNMALGVLKSGVQELPDTVTENNQDDTKEKLNKIATDINTNLSLESQGQNIVMPPPPPSSATSTEALPSGWERKTADNGKSYYYENQQKHQHYWVKGTNEEGNVYYYASDDPTQSVWNLNDVVGGGNKKRHRGKSKRRYKRRRGKSSRRRI